MLHQLIRYHPVLDMLAGGSYSSLCEVGSGSGGLARFSRLRVVGVDMDFMDYTGHRLENPPNLIPVIADAGNLPFDDGKFDLVFSCDMLEHVPIQYREAAVFEMLRVAKKTVVLVFPSGRTAAVLDRIMLKVCKTLKLSAPGWLEEHVGLGLPSRAQSASIIAGTALPFRIKRNGFIPLHYISLVLESNIRIREALSGLCLDYLSDAPGGPKKWLARALLDLSDLPPAYRISVVIDKTRS